MAKNLYTTMATAVNYMWWHGKVANYMYMYICKGRGMVSLNLARPILLKADQVPQTLLHPRSFTIIGEDHGGH